MKTLTLLALSLLALLLAACGGAAEPVSADSLTTINITAEDIAFSPDKITVKAGQRVRLTFENEGDLLHDFSLSDMPLHGEVVVREQPSEDDHADEMDAHAEEMDDGHDSAENHAAEPVIHMAASHGDRFVIEFTPSEPGIYEFVCTVEGHIAAGMVGELIVLDS